MERSYHNLSAHRKSARSHFITRCKQRYGLRLSQDDYKQILQAVKHNQRNGKVTAFFTRDLDEYTKLYQVNFNETTMYVIYNVFLHEITTSLPENPKEIQYHATGTSIF